MAADEEKKVGKGIFLGLTVAGLVSLILVSCLTWYLIEPRLAQWYPGLPLIVGWVVGGFLLLVTIEVGLIIATAVTERNVLFPKGEKQLTISLLFPILMVVGRVFGFSKETIRKSFISVNNALVRATRRAIRPDRILILLPQCLQNSECPRRITTELENCVNCGRCAIGRIRELARRYQAALAVATGGTLARKVVVETKPTVIVAVACDRDLTSGIQYAHRIPTLGILNRRPFGPCLNTDVRLAELEQALEFICPGRTPATGKAVFPAAGTPDRALPEKEYNIKDHRKEYDARSVSIARH